MGCVIKSKKVSTPTDHNSTSAQLMPHDSRRPYEAFGALRHLGHSCGALGALVWGTWGTRVGHLGHFCGTLGALVMVYRHKYVHFGTWGTFLPYMRLLIRTLGARF